MQKGGTPYRRTRQPYVMSRGTLLLLAAGTTRRGQLQDKPPTSLHTCYIIRKSRAGMFGIFGGFSLLTLFLKGVVNDSLGFVVDSSL